MIATACTSVVTTAVIRSASSTTCAPCSVAYAAEPDVLTEELREDQAIAEADTLLLTVPNTVGVEYNAHVIESILTHAAPALGWR